MRIFTVKIDRETGEWIGKPLDMNESTTAADWRSRLDSDQFHYDTAEIDGETIAVLCEYVG